MKAVLEIVIVMCYVSMTTSCNLRKPVPKPAPKPTPTSAPKIRHASCPVGDKRNTCTIDNTIVCEGYVKFSNCRHHAFRSWTTTEIKFCGKNKVNVLE